MLKRIFTLFSGLGVTLAAGLCLAASLLFMLTKTAVFFDPAWITVVVCGFPLLYLALTRLFFEKMISSALLISIAMLASLLIGELFAAGEVAFIMAIGGILEDKTVERAKKGIRQLISLAPEQGRLIRDGREEILPITAVRPGALLRVLPGEAIPVDGEIVAGNTSVDQSLMTGESLPVDKAPGDAVFCGTINRFGSVDIRVTRAGEDSSLQKLIRLVQEAEHNKAPMQRVADKWAAWLVPIALAIAILSYLLLRDITRAVTILVVFCPCALALATPTSIMAAIGQAAKQGVIIKSGDALERMGKADCIVFDKTGTLTQGKLTVSDVVSFDEAITADELLALSASAEARSEHPLGKAIAAQARERGLALRPAEDFRMIPGKGVISSIDGETILCGNDAWLRENGVAAGARLDEALETCRREGKAVVIVADKSAVKGIIALSDRLRPAAKDMVRELRATGADLILLTGDHQQTADYFAGQAGITRVYAELLPEEKVEWIGRLQGEGRKVCMIGDGVNDAPALKTADVGVAMGSMGSDIAVEAADIALAGDDIAKIPYLRRLSKAAVKLIKFNISLSMLINFAAIILSLLGVLNPISGALVHNVGSVLIVLNAALLYDRKYS